MMNTGNIFVDLISFLYVSGSVCIGIAIILYVCFDSRSTSNKKT